MQAIIFIKNKRKYLIKTIRFYTKIMLFLYAAKSAYAYNGWISDFSEYLYAESKIYYNNRDYAGLFVLNADIRTDQMCNIGEKILCNAFVIGIEPNGQFIQQAIPQLVGQTLDCPMYPYINRIVGIHSEKCNLYANYMITINCLNTTTGNIWIAPLGFFEVKCLEEQVAVKQYEQMQNLKYAYEKNN